MIDLAPELRAFLERLLADRREAILDAGTDWIVGASTDLRGRRPRHLERLGHDRWHYGLEQHQRGGD